MIAVDRSVSSASVHADLAIGRGRADIKTGARCLDHGIHAIARCLGLDLTIAVSGGFRTLTDAVTDAVTAPLSASGGAGNAMRSAELPVREAA